MREGLCPWQVSACGHAHSQWHRLGPFPAWSVQLHVPGHECLSPNGLRTVLPVSPLDLKVGGRLGQGLHETVWITADACFLWLSHPFAFWDGSSPPLSEIFGPSDSYIFSQALPLVPGLFFSSFRSQWRHPIFRKPRLSLALLLHFPTAFWMSLYSVSLDSHGTSWGQGLCLCISSP